MVSKPIVCQANFNALAKMVSNASLQRIIFDEDFKRYGKQIKSLLKKSGLELQNKCTFRELLQHSYDHLSINYRHEYLYKTALLNSYILRNYSLSDTILLNEFKIGSSKADCVLVNGTNKVFEIKTELDNPDRLNSQLNDYYKAFSEVYIVIHCSSIDKYVQLLNPKVGIMIFKDNSIEVFRTATYDQSKLETVTMMKALRKEEYLQIVKKLTGNVPSVQPVFLFKACLDIVSNYAVDEIQSEFLKVIKQRINHRLNEFISASEIPDMLRHSCYHSNMNQNEYLSLIKRLSISL